MFAVAAAVSFGVALVLRLAGVDAGRLDLVVLGLLLLALHLAFASGWSWGPRG